MQPRRILGKARREGRAVAALVDTEVDLLRSRRGRADVALFHEFAPSPSGGGHQFLRALVREFEGRGLEVEVGTISGGTPVCLFNSFNFDFRRLRRFARRGARMVHRVDGPIGAYRGFDDGTDARIAEINAALASTTIFQSEFSLAKHRELGFELREPVVIPNAVDPAIFHPPTSREPLEGRRIRLVASSWSDNPRKGVGALEWLDRNLDPDRFELTFAGRPADGVRADPRRRAARLERARRRCCARRTSTSPRAATTRARTPCSKRSRAACRPRTATAGATRSSSERAALPFREDEELGAVLDRLVAELDARRAAISTRSHRVGRGPLPRGPRRCARTPRIPRPWRTTCDGASVARASVSDKRLDRAAVSRAHDVLYLSDAWTEATWLGAQALKNPLDLWVYQEIMAETRPELVVETGTYRGGSACFLASICDLLGSRERSSRSTSSRCATTTRAIRGSPTSAAAPRPTRTSWPRSVRAQRGSARS